MKKELIKEVEDFELRHKIIFFILVMVMTIIITRILVLIKDPNIIIKGYELHHFYYGITLLIITSLIMLFGKKHFKICLFLSAISIGLIIDEFLYIADGFGDTKVYLSTLPSVIVFATIILLIVILIDYINNYKK